MRIFLLPEKAAIALPHLEHLLLVTMEIGVMGSCVRLAGSTQREPTVVGKPEEFMLANIAAKSGLRRDQICMVGDRLDTDIQFGLDGGLMTMLVLSGARSCTPCFLHPPLPRLLCKTGLCGRGRRLGACSLSSRCVRPSSHPPATMQDTSPHYRCGGSFS